MNALFNLSMNVFKSFQAHNSENIRSNSFSRMNSNINRDMARIQQDINEMHRGIKEEIESNFKTFDENENNLRGKMLENDEESIPIETENGHGKVHRSKQKREMFDEEGNKTGEVVEQSETYNFIQNQ